MFLKEVNSKYERVLGIIKDVPIQIRDWKGKLDFTIV